MTGLSLAKRKILRNHSMCCDEAEPEVIRLANEPDLVMKREAMG
jgi:hypothetical protein